MKNFDELPDSALIRLKALTQLCGISPATVWRWSKDGRLPKPRKVGSSVTVWNAGEIRKFLAGEGE
ncbi:helix-turn-helix transcriptional regulator [Ferrovum myxofaciens]|uniref:helix-turn-helix transcriptional regulator n=1 Tax=Ferrovum myxofaciens TaxID=416213 RepID=UPI002357B051|nr:AlpA family phage regulatory protein [Ferrovum myxofaciens]MBU6995848.1 AlpA family phage regulatory protein [Ferrovum myxofaciens]